MEEQQPSVIPEDESELLLSAAETHIPDVRARYARGEITLHPGDKAGKPVVRDAETNRFVKGSGRPLRNPERVAVGHWRQSKPAREAFNALMPIEGDKSQRGTLPWMYEQAIRFIEGTDAVFKCRGCGTENVVPHQKRDARMLVAMFEQRLGRAPQKMEIEERSARVVAILDGRLPVDEVQLTRVSVEEQEERKRRAREDGVVEGDWMEE